jgi:hypothetical protein
MRCTRLTIVSGLQTASYFALRRNNLGKLSRGNGDDNAKRTRSAVTSARSFVFSAATAVVMASQFPRMSAAFLASLAVDDSLPRTSSFRRRDAPRVGLGSGSGDVGGRPAPASLSARMDSRTVFHVWLQHNSVGHVDKQKHRHMKVSTKMTSTYKAPATHAHCTIVIASATVL